MAHKPWIISISAAGSGGRRRGRPLPATAVALLLLPVLAAAATAGSRIATEGASANSPACAPCHGEHGQGKPAAGIPRLAGLNAAYIEAQLNAFADGRRRQILMPAEARTLTPAQRRTVAEYYAGLTPSRQRPAPRDPDLDPGARLALRGRPSDGIPACITCHGPQGVGRGALYPPLAGQPATYLAAQLRSWRRGTRPPGPMACIADKFSEADIEAVSSYFGTWAPTAAGTIGSPHDNIETGDTAEVGKRPGNTACH